MEGVQIFDFGKNRVDPDPRGGVILRVEDLPKRYNERRLECYVSEAGGNV